LLRNTKGKEHKP